MYLILFGNDKAFLVKSFYIDNEIIHFSEYLEIKRQYDYCKKDILSLFNISLFTKSEYVIPLNIAGNKTYIQQFNQYEKL